MPKRDGRPVVAIIGGGFTGAAVAYHLVGKLGAGTARIAVFEPRSDLGRGLAYDTDDPVHRINVPAARMTFIPDDAEHFQRWLHSRREDDGDPESITKDGRIFAQRRVFGRYVAEQLAPLVESGAVEHIRARVSLVEASDGRWRVQAEGGARLVADILVIATTHPKPRALAAIDRVLRGHPRYVPDAMESGALAVIRRDDRVLLVGAGLTAADVIASLDANGHRGVITTISRRGLRSRGHPVLPVEPYGDFINPPSLTVVHLLRRVRRTIQQASAEGISWHAVFDGLRAQGREIWRALSIQQRRRLVRYLRPYWDVHRFRIAPQLEDVIRHRLASASLSFSAASVVAAALTDDGTILVTLRHRHGHGETRHAFDAVILTTGPGHDAVLSSQTFLAALEVSGFLQADAVGLGIEVDAESHPIDRDGSSLTNVLIAGPLARGTFGELMGLPQVTSHAVFVAEKIYELLRDVASK
ncbi:hydroxyacylglutathione hydrolase [Ensifer sp. NM-2]|uniref:FAD/NAD(P)-binding protein n=1 Tax=Ensifer sp. NM-2 TaxID=2109730 RepID=UPI000D1372A2|nr:FAD/NAD(P)-binding protein [Ensifer sp. NM-2]PSS59745.1 hydroxyacylglutathione hydrolase [Ensifer sp. NM-2]